jgi:Druantia protein DruA
MIVPEAMYCGRQFSGGEIGLIRRIIAEDPRRTREDIAKIVCHMLGWYKPDGGLKSMSCKVALLRMHEDTLITLPPPRQRNGNGRVLIQYTLATEPDTPTDVSVGELSELSLELVANKKESYLWNEYIARYHYLGYTPLPGAQVRYFAVSNGQLLGLMGFGASAWKVEPRDTFIGWSDAQRRRNLHLVVNNARFLILPWVTSKNLASKLLAMAAKRLPDDWQQRYKYSPVLLETFVEIHRFRGTCYKAANWISVGKTKGRGKCDVKNTANLPVKDIWLYPLVKSFRNILCS